MAEDGVGGGGRVREGSGEPPVGEGSGWPPGRVGWGLVVVTLLFLNVTAGGCYCLVGYIGPGRNFWAYYIQLGFFVYFQGLKPN